MAPIQWSQGMQDSIIFEVDTLIDLDSATAVFTIWRSYSDTATIYLDTMEIGTNTVRAYMSSSITDTMEIGIFPADVWVSTKTGQYLQIFYKYLNLRNSSKGRN